MFVPYVPNFMRWVFILMILSFSVQGQQNILILGNHSSLCLDKGLEFEAKQTLPDSLNDFKVIMLFSNSTSTLTNKDVERIVTFIEKGGGLYSGAENWPLQAESNQVTHRLYQKKCFGNYQDRIAECSEHSANLNLKEVDTIPAGSSTVAFPMDHRLKVEAWINDQPLILSGELGKGRIIIDGGYSRFYCNQRNEFSDLLFKEILLYLHSETGH
jgi:hypothetical protein